MKRICLLLIFLIITTPLSAKIIMKPYSQAVNHNSAVILVECNIDLPLRAMYNSRGGESKMVSSNEKKETSKGTFVFRLRLEGLNPDTEYGLKIAQNDMETAIDAVHFKTAPLNSESLRFGIMGNTNPNPDITSQLADLLMERSPQFVVFTGDLAAGSTYESWKKEFFTDAVLNMISHKPFYNAVGDKEKWDKNTQAFTQGSNGDKPHFSFDAGDVHFLVLSTEHDADSGSDQWEFADDDLEKTNKKWKIAVFHKSAYCYGAEETSEDMREMSEELFEKHDVDLVLTGDYHFYQHNNVNGIRHILIGGGGVPMEPPAMPQNEPESMKLETNQYPYLIKSAKEYTFATADVSDTKLTITVYNIANKEIDKIILEK